MASKKFVPPTGAADACNLIPSMTAAEVQVLTESVARWGCLTPIEVLDGEIIEGRHRFAACQKTGRDPVYTEIELPPGMTPEQYVLAVNVARRHLPAEVRIRLAEKALRERPAETPMRSTGPPVEVVAAAANVSPASVSRARRKDKPGRPPETETAGTTDALGQPLPPRQAAVFAAAPAIAKLARELSKLAGEITELSHTDLGIFLRGAPLQAILHSLEHARQSLLIIDPHSLCPICGGNGCEKVCKGGGWVPKTVYDRAAGAGKAISRAAANIKARPAETPFDT